MGGNFQRKKLTKQLKLRATEKHPNLWAAFPPDSPIKELIKHGNPADLRIVDCPKHISPLGGS